MGSHEESERKSPERSGSSTVSKKVAEIWEQMNKGVPNKRLNFVSQSSTALPAQKSANNVRFSLSAFWFSCYLVVWDFKCVVLLDSQNWEKYLGGVDAKKKDHCISNVQKEDCVTDDTCREEAKKIAAAALAAVRNATATAAAASSRGKIEVGKLPFLFEFVCLARHC